MTTPLTRSQWLSECGKLAEVYEEAMMTNKQTPPDWVLLEAFKRSGWDYTDPADLSSAYDRNAAFRALCDIILETKAPPVDR